MNEELIYCTERMQAAAAAEGYLTFYITYCHGFKQGVLKHIVNEQVKSLWMSCNVDETNYLIEKFFN